MADETQTCPYPKEANSTLIEFATGKANAVPLDASTIAQAERAVKTAVRHTIQPHITVDDDDGSLDFDLRLADGLLVMANLFPDGSVDASVYDRNNGIPVSTVRRIRRSNAAGAADFIRLLHGNTGAST